MGAMRTFAGLPFVLTALIAASGACSKPAATAEAIAAATARAEQAAGALNGALIKELTAALAKGPAQEAVQVCSEVAQSITERTRAEQGVYLSRTALRLRNPKNAPSSAERAVLERWSADEEPKDWSEVVASEDGEQLLWMRPIILMPLCAQCHGSEGGEILPDTLATIRRLYPEDRATGFSAGDLRGAVTVRVPL
jgi:hypothetical protein